MKSALIVCFLATIYAISIAFVWMLRWLPRRTWQPSGCIMVTGTFYNPNWFISHAKPLAQCGVGRVIFVTDTPRSEVEGIEFITPPAWMMRLLGRAGAKFVELVIGGVRHKPDCIVGYHFFPSGLSALLIGKILNRPSCYQMCAGPIEIIGGGNETENALLSQLKTAYPLLERMSMWLLREFDSIVVRGSTAQQFLTENGVKACRVTIIPGSINLKFVGGSPDRPIDVVFVGRLAEIKQPIVLLETITALIKEIPNLKVVVVGEGPMRQDMESFIERKGLSDYVQLLGQRSDVETIVGRSKIFLLTSRNEGLSIAMAEAMAAGAVPVVADVGDLSDLVEHGRCGYVVSQNSVHDFVSHMSRLLKDEDLWSGFSRNAVEAARSYNGLDVVSERWRETLNDTAVRHLSREVG